MRTGWQWSPTYRADQSNIPYTLCPRREVLLILSIRQKTKWKSYHERQRSAQGSVLRRREKMKLPGAYSHWRLNTVRDSGPHRCLLCCTAAGSSPLLWLASGHWSTPFTPKRVMGQWCLFLSQWPLFVECVLHLCVYLSVWLLVMVERDDEMIWISRPLRCLSWVMYGSHTGRLEFGKVESKFILHPSKGSCSQVVTSNVVHIDGRKLWDSRLGFGFGSSWTTAERRGHDESFHNQSCLVTL